MDLSLAIRIAIVVAAALLLWWLFAGYLRRDREKTEHMLDPFLPVLESPLVGRSPWGYEYLEGSFDGSAARVSLIPDTLITRTLPTLWLEMRWAQHHDAWLCVIADANGMEYFAEDVDEGARMVSPDEWPEAVVVRGKGPGSLELRSRLRDLDIRAYTHLKMITISETETKVIMRCARAEVPLYRVLRAANFPEDAVKPELVFETVRVLRDIERKLGSGEEVA